MGSPACHGSRIFLEARLCYRGDFGWSSASSWKTEVLLSSLIPGETEVQKFAFVQCNTLGKTHVQIFQLKTPDNPHKYQSQNVMPITKLHGDDCPLISHCWAKNKISLSYLKWDVTSKSVGTKLMTVCFLEWGWPILEIELENQTSEQTLPTVTTRWGMWLTSLQLWCQPHNALPGVAVATIPILFLAM